MADLRLGDAGEGCVPESGGPMTPDLKLHSWKSRLLQSRFMKSAGLMAGAAVIGQLLMLAATPLLTRLYDPSAFGIFAVVSASMGLILVISSLRYEMAIPIMRNDRSARSVLVSALGINALTAGATLAVLLAWRVDVARLLNMSGQADYLLLIPLGLLGAGSYRALNFWALRKNEFGVVAQTKLTQSISNVAVQVVAGVVGVGAIGLIVGHIFGFTAGVVRLAKGAGLKRRAFVLRDGLRRTVVLLGGLSRFPKFDVPGSLVDFLGVQLPNLVLAALFGPVAAGTYFLADRILTAPMSIVSQAISQAVLAGARETIAQRRLLRQTLRIILSLAAAVALPAIVIMIAGEHLFSRVFDESWRQAGIYAAWLVPGFAVQFIYSSISTTLAATKGQKLNLAIHSCLLVLKVAALWVGQQTGDPLRAIIGLSLANVIGGVLAIGVVLAHIAWIERRRPIT